MRLHEILVHPDQTAEHPDGLRAARLVSGEYQLVNSRLSPLFAETRVATLVADPRFFDDNWQPSRQWRLAEAVAFCSDNPTALVGFKDSRGDDCILSTARGNVWVNHVSPDEPLFLSRFREGG